MVPKIADYLKETGLPPIMFVPNLTAEGNEMLPLYAAYQRQDNVIATHSDVSSLGLWGGETMAEKFSFVLDSLP